MITVRCKKCNKEITGELRPRSCGCPNMMTVTEDKVTAVDINDVIMVRSTGRSTSKDVLSNSDLMYQEERRKRKVRKLDFEVR